MRSAARLRLLATRTLRIFVATILVGCLVFLPFAGRYLEQQDPLVRADLILVLAGSRTERWLEAVDLFNEGWAPRIAVSPGHVDPIETELEARGIRYPREGELARDAIVASGVPAEAVAVLPSGVDNTAHEAAATLQYVSGATTFRRVIVVTSPLHTRRTGFAFRRAFAGTGVDVIVRGSRHSESDPARWWRRRADIRWVVSEMQKLIVYAAGVRE